MKIRNRFKNHKKLKISILFFFILFVVCSVFSYFPTVEIETIEKCENPVRFAVVSDLHSCRYGKNQKKLIKMLDKYNPDVVFLVGDIIDNDIPEKNAKIFLEQISRKYKCFFVSGNHEYFEGKKYSQERITCIKSYLRAINIQVLEGDCASLKIKNKTFDICGIDDPKFISEEKWKNQLSNAYSKTNKNNKKILLSHRPEKVEEYKKYDFDLIACGHAHGGQLLIPFFNRGLFAPNQNFFAKYINGKYDLSDKTTMIVSRGLARESTLFPRLFNRPEIVIIEI